MVIDKETTVLFQNFGESSLDFVLIVWIDEPLDQPLVASDLRFASDAAFRKQGIQIPFPQRDLHLKSGFPAAQVLDRERTAAARDVAPWHLQ